MRLSVFLATLLSLSGAATPAAVAGSRSWHDDTSDGVLWNRPNEDLQTVSTLGPVRFHSLQVWVDQSGNYDITSQQAFDGFMLLYDEPVDPAQPLHGLVAANDNGPAGVGSSKITARLEKGLIYRVVTTGHAPGDAGVVNNTVAGPGAVRFSSCFVGDEPAFHDEGDTAVSVQGERFCVIVAWTDFAGRHGSGTPVRYRTDDSTELWFFGDDNWELTVKVLNGCGVNGHHWVFVSGTTTVAFDVEVDEIATATRHYQNPLGHAASLIADTAAFACP